MDGKNWAQKNNETKDTWMKGKELDKNLRHILPLSSGMSQRTRHTVGPYSAYQLHQLFLTRTGSKLQKISASSLQ